jgi:hypothetical protein
MYRGMGDPLQVTVHPICWAQESDISGEALQQLRDMQAEDAQGQQTNSINVSNNNQSGYGLNPCPPKPGIYWMGLFILAGCIAGAIVLRKVRK